MGIPTAAMWNWTAPTSGNVGPTVNEFSSGQQTKTGLLPADLKQYVTVPLQDYSQNPPVAVDDEVILKWIRWAEDWVESQTGMLLCQSWVASPPALTPQATLQNNLTLASGGQYQQLGIDYDIEDAGYDFIYPRARDEGWMVYSLRYKPVKSITYNPTDTNAIKQITYQYPLLNQFFAVPPTWHVEDHDFGLLRLVPSTNIQMLPLFAMQLAFMGFAESVPGAIWMQYTAGLTKADYSGRWSFILQLVLAQAAITGLQSIQGTINLGAAELKMFVDGLQYGTRYHANGPFGFLISQFEKNRDTLLATALSKVAGPVLTTI
jgi:hypothetical protein